MRYQLDDIAAFLHVVETGSISAAARQMNLSKSVVSKRVTPLSPGWAEGLKAMRTNINQEVKL